MKTLLGWLCVGFFTFSASAAQIEGVEARLNFEEGYTASHERLDHSRLSVVLENVQFSVLDHEQQEQFRVALSLLEDTLNSEEFKRKVLSYKRSDGRRLFQKNYLWDNEENELSNEDVYNIIKAGDEKMIPGTVGEMNIFSWIKKCQWYDYVRTPKWCRGVVGSTDPRNTEWIKLNYNYYQKYQAPDMVNNLVHEWIHLLGFLHGSENVGEEAPYVVGKIAEQVARNLLKQNIY